MDTVARNFQGGPAMRFLMTVNGGGAPPDEQLFAEMRRLVEELTRAGVLLATGGLDRGPHVTASGGPIQLTDGPFPESKEVTASFGLSGVRSKAGTPAPRRGWPAGGKGSRANSTPSWTTTRTWATTCCG